MNLERIEQHAANTDVACPPERREGERGGPRTRMKVLVQRSALPTQAARMREIRNCLAAAGGVNQALASGLGGSALEWLGHSWALLLRAQGLLEAELRQGARPQVGAMRECSGALVVRTVLANVQERARARSVYVRASCDDSVFLADSDALTLALENVVVSAIEASDALGLVCVVARQLPGGDQQWTIEDRGRRMPAQGPGHVGACRESRVAGLAVTREIVEEHGGLLRVESTADAGTLVSLWLPAAVGTEQRHERCE